jgi:hypothetical protein
MHKHIAFHTLILIIILATTSTQAIIQTASATSPESFSIIWITDTQYLAESNPQLNDNLSRWIINNAQLYNAKMVIHTGDLVNDEGNHTHWQNANQSMKLLLDNDIPYCWCAGNHDYNSSYYAGNQYAAFNPQVLASKPYWVSTVYDGMNNAVYFNASGWECLIVAIAYGADDTVFSWANGLLDEYPTAHAIIAAHAYIDKQCRYNNWAAQLKEKVLDTHANVFLTLSGHYYPTPGNRTTVGGRDELLFNQQDAYSKQGAASARILTFNLEIGTINVQTYSVYLNGFVDDSNNNFTITTAFRNDAAGKVGFSFVWVVAAVLVLTVAGGGVFLVKRRLR